MSRGRSRLGIARRSANLRDRFRRSTRQGGAPRHRVALLEARDFPRCYVLLGNHRSGSGRSWCCSARPHSPCCHSAAIAWATTLATGATSASASATIFALELLGGNLCPLLVAEVELLDEVLEAHFIFEQGAFNRPVPIVRWQNSRNANISNNCLQELAINLCFYTLLKGANGLLMGLLHVCSRLHPKLWKRRDTDPWYRNVSDLKLDCARSWAYSVRNSVSEFFLLESGWFQKM